jgi:IS4 transposase
MGLFEEPIPLPSLEEISFKESRDEQIELRGPKTIERCPYPLRRIEVQDPETGEIVVFLTNNFDLGASTIGAIYKDRWGIEIFFKHLKQNLKIKTFIGTSPNAVKIQIWTALIAMLILKFLQLRIPGHSGHPFRSNSNFGPNSSGRFRIWWPCFG